MQMSKRVRGSVSILLTLILLPMVTYATMIVDASRLQIARTNISGAGDLALNAMMSDYNEMLAEMYGLFANTTNEEDIQDVLAGYFQQTIEGKYLPSMHSEDGAYIQNIIHELLSDTADWTTGNHVATTELDDEKITELTDFLKMQLEDMTASAVTGSALANPNTMKRQIIEYMKYRGPLSIGSTLLGKLDYLKGSDQQVDACDNKVQYAEKLGQMQGPCLEIYNAITDKYNTGAVMMNELTGQQGVTAERDANGNWKEQTNHLLSGADTLITESDVNMQYATTFYLMDAMSPYYNWSSNHPDFFDYASLAGGKEAYKNAEEKVKKVAEEKISAEMSENMLSADKNPAVESAANDEAAFSARDARIRSNLERLNAILTTAGYSCGYDSGHHILDYVFDKVSVKVENQIWYTSSYARSPGDMNKFEATDHSNIKINDKISVDIPGKGKTDVIAPNLNRLTNIQDGLNAPFKAFMKGSGTFIQPVFDTSKIDTSDKTPGNQFKDQIQKSFDVLKAQEDLQNSMKYGMEDAAKRQQRMQVLIDGYNNIWKQVADDLKAQYEYTYNKEKAEADQKVQENLDNVNAWISNYRLVTPNPIVGGYGWDELSRKDKKAFEETWDSLSDEEKAQWEEDLTKEWERFNSWKMLKEYVIHNTCYPDVNKETWQKWAETDLQWDSLQAAGAYPGLLPEDMPTWPNATVQFPDCAEVWERTLSGLDNIDDLEQNYCALNRLKDTVFPGYKGAFNQYISTAVFNNNYYFQNYGTAYADESISGLIGLAATLETMKEGLTFASGKLQTLHDMFTGPDGLNAKQSAWKNSIDAINSDSSKAAMTSDFNTLTDQFSQKEVDQLKTLIDDTILKQVTQAIANVKGITYMNIQLVQVDGNGKTLSEMHNNKDDIEGKIKDKLWHSKYYNAEDPPTDEPLDEPHKVAQQATGTMWDTVSASNSTIRFKIPSFTQNEDIKKNADALKDKLTDLDAYKKIAIELVKGFDKANNTIKYPAGGKYNYDSMCGTKDGKIDYSLLQDAFKHFQILDGLVDAKGSTYTWSEQDKANFTEMMKKSKDDEKSVEAEFMDTNEALMVALYAEAKAAKTSSELSSESGESKSVDNLTASAQQTIDDSQKEETPAPAEGESLAHVDIATIMNNVQNYCQNKENQSGVDKYGTPPAMETASIKKGNDKKKEGDENTSSGGALKAAKELLADIANIGDKVVENLYLEEYFTEMFTCRTDNQNLNKLTAEKDKNALPVIMMNGFGNEAAHPGAARTLNTKTEWYGKEVEYLLWGNNNLDTNLAYTDGMIFAIRFALNAIYAFTAVDIQTYALELATAIAGWTVIGVPIVQACITILIALAESGYDLYLLHDGREVPIYKNQATFVCSPTGMLRNVATEIVTQITDEVIDSCADKIEEKLNSEVDNFVEKFNGLVDDASNMSEEEVDQLVDTLEGTITEFTDKQADAIKSGVREQFITPVINQLVSLVNLAEINAMYQEIDPSKLVTDAVDKAFKQITDNINAMDPEKENSIRTVCQNLLMKHSDVIDTLKNDIVKELNDYVSKLDEQANKVFNIDDMLYKKLGGYVDEAIGKVNEEINGEVAKASDYIKKQFKNKVTAPLSDKAKETAKMTAETAKGYISETMDQATAMLTGQGRATAEGLIDTMPNGNPVDTNASSGVTLTYKEYCKILMILFVSINQDQVLQRAAVLIQANMSNLYESNPYKEENAGFDITKANTLFSLNAKIRMATLFPWPARDELNEANMNGGLQLDFNEIHTKTMTINYCGVNGY